MTPAEQQELAELEELEMLEAKFSASTPVPAEQPRPPRQRTGSGVVPVDVREMGTMERVARGALGGIEDAGLGAVQLGNLLTQGGPFENPEGTEDALRSDARGMSERKAPLYDTTAGTVGRVLTSMFLPGSTLPRALASGAAYGALQPEEQEGDRLKNALQGGVGFGGGNLAAQGIGKVVSRAVSPLRGAQRTNPIQGARDAAVKEAEDLGLQVSAGARTGNRVAQGLESVMARAPITGGRAQRFGEENLAKANQTLAKQFGSKDEVLTKQVFAEARERVGSQFDDLMSPGTKIEYDGRFISKMKTLKDEVSLLPEKMQSSKLNTVVKALYDDILPQWSRGKVSIDGQRYGLLRSELSDQARSLARKKPNVSRQIDSVIRALDDMAGRSLSEADQAAFKVARKQWQGLRMAEDAVDKYGNVTMAKLDASIAKHKPKATAGRDVHRELSRSLGVIRDQIANSGTPERLQAIANMNPVTLAMSGAMGYAARPLQELLLNQTSARVLGNSQIRRMMDVPGVEELLEASRRGAGAGTYGTLQEQYQ